MSTVEERVDGRVAFCYRIFFCCAMRTATFRSSVGGRGWGIVGDDSGGGLLGLIEVVCNGGNKFVRSSIQSMHVSKKWCLLVSVSERVRIS